MPWRQLGIAFAPEVSGLVAHGFAGVIELAQRFSGSMPAAGHPVFALTWDAGGWAGLPATGPARPSRDQAPGLR
jgi:hypothetical protein